jgi:hypothetical protein
MVLECCDALPSPVPQTNTQKRRSGMEGGMRSEEKSKADLSRSFCSSPISCTLRRSCMPRVRRQIRLDALHTRPQERRVWGSKQASVQTTLTCVSERSWGKRASRWISLSCTRRRAASTVCTRISRSVSIVSWWVVEEKS